MANNTRLAIVLGSPTGLDVLKQKMLWGDNYSLLEALLKSVGFNLHDTNQCFVTYAVPYKLEEKLTKEVIQKEHVELLKELADYAPDKILAVGSVALSVLRNSNKPVNINKERGLGEVIFTSNGPVFTVSTYEPWMIFKNPDYFRDARKDFWKLANHDRPIVEPEVDIWIPESVEELQDAFIYFSEYPKLSIDVESTGFSPLGDKMTAIGFGAAETTNYYNDGQRGKALVIPVELIHNDKTKKLVADFITGRTYTGKLIFHNAMFDLQFLTAYINESLLDANVDDTILMSYLVDERGIGGEMGRGVSPHGLKTLSRVYFDQADYHFEFREWAAERSLALEYLINPDNLNKYPLTFIHTDEFNPTTWNTISEVETNFNSLYKYLGLDLIYTAQMYDILCDQINNEDADLWEVYNRLLIPGTKTLAEVTLTGAPVDVHYLENLAEKLQTDISKLKIKIKELLKGVGCPEEFYQEFNPNSPAQIASALYKYMQIPVVKTKKKKENKKTLTNKKSKVSVSVNADVLKEIKKKYPKTNAEKFIDLVLLSRTKSKLHGTYALGLLESAKYDGFAHGAFRVIGTVTGRLSSANPNLQNIPSHSGDAELIKAAFVAPAGYKLIGLDLSQAEYRVVGHLSNDKELIKIYENNIDLHRYVASMLFNKSVDEVTDDERYVSKQIGFSLLYGKTTKGMAETLSLKLGPDWTEEKVEGVLNKFLSNFKELATWMEDQKITALSQHKTKFSLGRIRRYPFVNTRKASAVAEIKRYAVNTPPQGIASDLVLNAAINVHRKIFKFGAYLVLIIHDAIYVICPDKYVKEVINIMYKEMTQNTLMDLIIPLESDIQIGQNWAELKKVNKSEYIYG